MTSAVSFAEVQRHNKQEDCWVVLHKQVYNLSSFVTRHPGGVAVLIPWFGRDGTLAFTQHHNTDVLSIVKTCLVGRIDEHDEAWLTDVESQQQSASAGVDALAERRSRLPPISSMLNTRDFEQAAEQCMDPAGWAYYSSAADDEVTLRENMEAFGRVWIRPRVLVDVTKVDMSCSLLGTRCSFPLYISATALAKLADPAGELALSRACAAEDAIYMVPTLGSCSLEEIAAVRQPGQTHWFQLYVNPNRDVTLALVRRAEQLGCRALFVTVDAPQLGRREKDMRFKAKARSHVQKDAAVETNEGTARSLSSFIDPALSWADLQWLSSITSMPICIKGVQCGEDAVLAAQHGCKAIVISNHGGRQLDYARSAFEVLPECIAALKAAGLRDQLEVFIDGGIRRGTDIFKALALGANGVGIGRPTLYALASYGEAGVAQCLRMLRDEFMFCLRMVGCRSLSEIRQEMVLTAKL